MGNAIKAEFRKIFSTKMWWALLIPAAVIAFVANLGVALAQKDATQGLPISVPVVLISLGGSFSFTAIFAAIFGAMAISGEFRHRTISTTFLTSASRGVVLSAKLVAYAVMGLLYGVVTLLAATIGALAGDSANALPSGPAWIEVSLVGIVIIAFWTLLGVGLGGLISNQIAAVVVLLAYTLAGEALIGVLLRALKADAVANYLPSRLASDSLISFSLQQFLSRLSTASGEELGNARSLLNIEGAPVWWAGGLLFIAYTAVFALLGWLVSRSRDIS